MSTTIRGVGTAQKYHDVLDVINVGKLAGAGMLGVGDIHLVHDGSDVPVKSIRRLFPKTNRWTTIQSALDACRAGANDYVFLHPKDDGYGTSAARSSWASWAQSANLDIDKSTTHLVGLSSGTYRPLITFTGAHSLRVGPDNTSDSRLYGVELSNLFIRGTGSLHVTCVTIGASALGFVFDTLIRNCDIQNNGTSAATAEVTDYGQRTMFVETVLGDTITHPDDNYLQIVPTAPANQAGGRIQDATFIRCFFKHLAAAVGDQFATIGAGGNMCLFRDCTFVNYNVGVTAMTVGIAVASGGFVVAQNCGMIGATAFGTTGLVLCVPGGMGLAVTSADVFNPSLAIDGAEPVAADT